MSVLSFPAAVPPPSRYSLGLIANTQTGGRSPFTGSEQTLALPGSRWGAELSWAGMEEGEWRALQAFLAVLGGRAGRFTWGPPAQPRRGTAPAPGGIFVDGAGWVGNSLLTRGWTVGTGLLTFRTGDMVGWNDPAGRPQLHVVTADTSVSPQGQSGVFVAPPIRRAPANNTPVTTTPAGIFRLVEDRNPLTFSGHTVMSDAAFTIEEAVFG